MRTVLIAMVTAAGVAAAAGLLRAGPLSPPAGPVAATYKTLGEIEPRVPIGPATTPGGADSLYEISQPGSYYLTGNVQGVSGKHGIKITAAGPVTIDLNGFHLDGASGGGPATQSGVRVMTAATRLTIMNGEIGGWGASGMYAILCDDAIIRGVRFNGNTETGLTAGDHCVIEECTFQSNGEIGLVTGSACTVSSSTASSNGTTGVRAGAGTVVTECTTYFNFGDGFSLGPYVILDRCTATNNAGDGISAGPQSRIAGCVATVNGAAGIRLAFVGNTVDGNNVEGNAVGIDADSSSNIIVRNIARGNGSNYEFAAGQTTGPIISAGGTITSSNPWANFSY